MSKVFELTELSYIEVRNFVVEVQNCENEIFW